MGKPELISRHSEGSYSKRLSTHINTMKLEKVEIYEVIFNFDVNCLL